MGGDVIWFLLSPSSSLYSLSFRVFAVHDGREETGWWRHSELVSGRHKAAGKRWELRLEDTFLSTPCHL